MKKGEMISVEENKKKLQFNIIKSDPTDGHKGYGKGALSLDNVSPVIIDVDAGEAAIDIGAMHARSVVEKGIKFLTKVKRRFQTENRIGLYGLRLTEKRVALTMQE